MRTTESKATDKPVKPIKVGIIGGGIAGITTALRLAQESVDAEKKYKITVFEAASEILSQTSDATPCRLGIGFHYPDIETAKSNLYAAISLIRFLAKTRANTFQVGSARPINHSLRRVKYAIANDSKVPPDQVVENFELLKEEYIRLIKLDPENKVLGDPKKFFEVKYRKTDVTDPQSQQIGEEKDFSELLDVGKISMILETCETLFNWPLFKAQLEQDIKDNSENVTIHKNMPVARMQRENLGNGRTIVVTNDGEKHPFDFVVNASWYNVDLLNKSLGVSADRGTVNRYKCMAIIKTPKELAEHSMMVGFGPFCSLSSRPGGIGYLTFEPVTNLFQYSSMQKQGDKEARYLNGELTKKEKVKYANDIIKGASQYMPALRNARPTESILKVGIVRTDGGLVDINKIDHRFRRTHTGVRIVDPSVVVNEARKHTYWQVNAEKTAIIIRELSFLRPIILKLYSEKPDIQPIIKEVMWAHFLAIISEAVNLESRVMVDDEKPIFSGEGVEYQDRFFNSVSKTCTAKSQVAQSILQSAFSQEKLTARVSECGKLDVKLAKSKKSYLAEVWKEVLANKNKPFWKEPVAQYSELDRLMRYNLNVLSGDSDTDNDGAGREFAKKMRARKSEVSRRLFRTGSGASVGSNAATTRSNSPQDNSPSDGEAGSCCVQLSKSV